jgi:subtilisin family serine protease
MINPLRRRRIVLIVCLSVLGLAPSGAFAGASAAVPSGSSAASSASAPFENNTVLVGFRAGTPPSDEANLEAEVGAPEVSTIGAGTHVLRVPAGHVLSTISALEKSPQVRYAQPDYIVQADTTPNDPSFGQLWGLKNTGQTVNGTAGTAGADIKAEPAWNVTTGSSSVVVGVVDTGVDYTHPDLASNIWSNNGTVNGCPAGTHGYNAITASCDPLDDNNHGTHVSGTIGAVGNNGIGVTGINWTTSIMGLKFLNAQGSGTTSGAIAAIDWAVKAKQAGVNVRVLNNSWGGGGFSQALLDEINKAGANDILFVAAAGNSSANVDTSAFYPCGYRAANEICVAATDQKDNLASFSNYGLNTVDLGAPGTNILSTVPGGYAYYNGTSMATPHVTGSAALILSLGYQSVATLKSTILNNIDPLPSLSGLVRTGGRLDVCKAIPACGSPTPTAPPVTPTGLTASPTTGSFTQIDLHWNDVATETGYKIQRSPDGSATTWTQIGTTGQNVITYRDTGLAPSTTYCYRVIATNSAGDSAPSTPASTTTNPSPPSAPTGLTANAVSSAQVNLAWTGVTGATGYKVQRSPDGSTGWTQVGTTTQTTYSDTGLTQNTTYYYRVVAYNSGGDSSPSNVAFATTPGDTTVPTTPANFKLTAGVSKIDLGWDASSDAGGNLAGYEIYRSSNGSPFTKIATTTGTSFRNAGLPHGQTYSYYVVAYDTAGNHSPPTGTLSAKVL